MRVVLLCHALPQPSSNGGPMTCWAVMTRLLEAGHEVVVGALRYPVDTFADEERERAVREQGAELAVLRVPPEAELRAAADPADPVAAVFPTAAFAGACADAIAGYQPDAAFVYHWDTLAASRTLAVPRLATVGDPWHLPIVRRWQRTPPRPSLSWLRSSAALLLKSVPATTRAMVTLLNEVEDAGCFQAHAAGWLRQQGAGRCEYFRSPLIDPGPVLPLAPDAHRRPKILLGPSNLEATSTSAGLELFAREILPRLERRLGSDGFEVHVVGEGAPPPALARLLPRPTVVLRGRVEPADDEFRTAYLQLVTTPFVLGIRLRIVSAFSYGCAVVAHASERANLPELKHGENALISGTGHGLADAIVRLVRDRALRDEIARGGRRTFEAYFHPDVAAKTLVTRLERLAAASPAPIFAAAR